MIRISAKHILLFKTLIHVLNLGFILTWYYWAFTDQLGADPVKTIIHFTGMGALNLLLLTLLVSPSARYLKQAQLMKLRRLFGLYSFTWALLHLSNYIIFDLQMAFETLLQDIIKRPYITVGFAAFVALLAMALTSNKFSQKQLKKRWHDLHKLIYPASLLIALHFIWSVKALDLEPVFYWLLLLMLLATRIRYVQKRLFA